MTRERAIILDELKQAVIDMDEDATPELAQEALNTGISAYDAIMEGLVKGMEVVGDLYEQEEYFIPEILLAADALTAGIKILEPHLPREAENGRTKIVMGVVQGDTHDIGKNLFKILLDAAGFEIHDLGRDVPLEKFVDKAEEVGANIISMTTLMTTTMDGMGKVVDILKERGIRDKYYVVVGGGPISQCFANSIGADMYGVDANSATRRLKDLMEVRLNG
jgi:dimethylamine corrinoid protein